MNIVRRPLASIRPHPAEQWIALASKVVVEECGLRYCPDPMLLAERLGLRNLRTDGRPEVIGDRAFCPVLPSLRQTSELRYRLLARHIVNRHGTLAPAEAAAWVAEALILPRIVALRVQIHELPDVQRYAPIALVRELYRQHRGSGPTALKMVASQR